MSLELTLLLRVVRRRISKGETLDSVLRDYPRLTGEEREQLAAVLKG